MEANTQGAAGQPAASFSSDDDLGERKATVEGGHLRPHLVECWSAIYGTTHYPVVTPQGLETRYRERCTCGAERWGGGLLDIRAALEDFGLEVHP